MLDAAALDLYTRGRIVDGDEEAERLLAAGVAEAQRYCGWHVTPEVTETVKCNGGALLLKLKTLKLVELIAVSENGVVLDVAADIEMDADASGCLFKTSQMLWRPGHSNIEVTFTHGFDTAPDFEAAVLSFIDRTSRAVDGGLPIWVGPFRWAEDHAAAGSAFTATELSTLDQYRLERSP